jgi:hypothetical protein
MSSEAQPKDLVFWSPLINRDSSLRSDDTCEVSRDCDTVFEVEEGSNAISLLSLGGGSKCFFSFGRGTRKPVC